MALAKCGGVQLRRPWGYASTSGRWIHASCGDRRRDLYRILGVDTRVSAKDLKTAYYKLSLKYHPDINKEDGAGAKFSEINQAYEILSNEGSRRTYDGETAAANAGYSPDSFAPGSAAEMIFKQRMANSRTRSRQPGSGQSYASGRNEWSGSDSPDFEEFQRVFRNRQAGGRKAGNFDEWYRQHYGQTGWDEKFSTRGSPDATEQLFQKRRNDWIRYQMYNKKSKDMHFLAVVSGLSFALFLLLGFIVSIRDHQPGGYDFHDRRTGRRVPMSEFDGKR